MKRVGLVVPAAASDERVVTDYARAAE